MHDIRRNVLSWCPILIVHISHFVSVCVCVCPINGFGMLEYYNRAISLFFSDCQTASSRQRDRLITKTRKNGTQIKIISELFPRFFFFASLRLAMILIFLLVNNNQCTRDGGPWMQCNFIALGHKHFYNHQARSFSIPALVIQILWLLRWYIIICAVYAKWQSQNIKIVADLWPRTYYNIIIII